MIVILCHTCNIMYIEIAVINIIIAISMTIYIQINTAITASTPYGVSV